MGGLIGASSGSGGWWPISLAFAILMIIEIWVVFKKAGRHGWAAIIPIYNLYVLIKVAKRPGWWLLLFLIPLVNIVIAFIVYIDVAKAFGKGTGFGVLMVFFPFILFGILAFGSATYEDSTQAAA